MFSSRVADRSAELHAEFARCFRDLEKRDLATSHLQANEVEKAVAVARGVVDTAAGLNSYRVNFYLDEFRNRLNSHTDSPAATDFETYAASRVVR